MLSLIDYCPIVYPTFQRKWHADVITKKLQDLVDGRIKRLMINMPPRHGKSLLSSVLFPSYLLAMPSVEKVMVLTYGDDLSKMFGGEVRDILKRPEWRQLSGGKRIRSDTRAKDQFKLSDGSEFNALGRGGPITGKGASYLIGDDLVKNMGEANSDRILGEIMGFYDAVANTRLETDDARILILMTRWSERDICGQLIDREKKSTKQDWEIIKIKARATEDEEWEGNPDEEGEPQRYSRLSGSVIWPERCGLERLKDIERDNPTVFTGMYQQEPHAVEGEIFKREEWQFYNDEMLKEITESKDRWKMLLVSIDTAFKAKERTDYTVGLAAGVTFEGRLFVLEHFRERLEFTDLKARCAKLIMDWRPDWTIIEDKASGTSLLQELMHDPQVADWSGFEPMKKKYDKLEYAQATKAFATRGLVYLPDEGCERGVDEYDDYWVPDFINELAAFPNGRYDDRVDAFTQLLMFCRNNDLLGGDAGESDFGIIGVA